MSKIVKKKDLDVLIESTLEKSGIKSLIKEDFNEEAKKAIITDWDDRVVIKLISSAKKEKDVNKLTILKKYLKQLTEKDPDADLALEFLHKVENDLKKFKESDDYSKNESTSSVKPLINEDFKSELDKFNKLTNYTYKK